MNSIYLPELLSIDIVNYTLYPNGLNFHYNFVKGVNLILGGNGMGKTTFVNIIKFALIGPYRRQFSYTRTYREQKIEKRILSKVEYFQNRTDATIKTNGRPLVTLHYKINQVEICVTRALDDSSMQGFSIGGQSVIAEIMPQSRFEKLSAEDKTKTLPGKYEKEVEKLSGRSFDDIIFFVNEILFFGENHKTILWYDEDNYIDVQDELFNKYFNDRKHDEERKEAKRQAQYYDSLSRHRSEDMRAITKALSKVRPQINGNGSESEIDIAQSLLEARNVIDSLTQKMETLQRERNAVYFGSTTLQHKLNDATRLANEIEQKKNQIESQFNASKWDKINPKYSVYLKQIKMNHVCPMCNQETEFLYRHITENPAKCIVCGQELKADINSNLKAQYEKTIEDYKCAYATIDALNKQLHQNDCRLRDLDEQYHNLEKEMRENQQHVRELEYTCNLTKSQSELQAIYDELERLRLDKERFQKMAQSEALKATEISKKMENTIIEITNSLSSSFAEYAELFLGVPCGLTYDSKPGDTERRLYPMIDGQVRWSEEELSESQRFFVDHSFRMCILTYFYTTPTFYIIETPDSSLDISYENNAAQVLKHFLKKPNSLIITSNLNNSSFVQNLVNGSDYTKVGLVGLLEIAKTSTIQNASKQMKQIYESLKEKLQYGSKNN